LLANTQLLWDASHPPNRCSSPVSQDLWMWWYLEIESVLVKLRQANMTDILTKMGNLDTDTDRQRGMMMWTHTYSTGRQRLE
jgi:hypothetical protein